MVAARGEEKRLRDAGDDIEAEDVDIEVVDAVDVRRLEMHVTDRHTRVDATLARLHRSHAFGCLRIRTHRWFQQCRLTAYSAACLVPAKRTRIDDAAMLTTTAPISPALTSLAINPAPSARAPST